MLDIELPEIPKLKQVMYMPLILFALRWKWK
jgi:hypothetical protein